MNVRSEVCKKANAMVKIGYTKSAAFKKAWAEVKAAANSVKTSELVAGMTIRVEYGDHGNFLTCTVVEVSKSLFLGRTHIVKATDWTGRVFQFCSKPDETHQKVA